VRPHPYSARERILLSIQAKYDRQKLPPLWLWRLIRPESGNETRDEPTDAPGFDPADVPGGTVPDDVLWESPRQHRRYHDPIVTHIYVDWSPKKKGRKKGVVETDLTAQIGISRAECRRLGTLLQTQDDLEGLVSTGESDFIFIPRPGDIFRFADDHYEIKQWEPPERYGPTRLPITWKGTAHLFRDDSTNPLGWLTDPPTPQPPLTPAPRHAWRG
jgi:hypothetical protein